MPPTFRDLIAANKRSSLLLVIVFILFTAAVVLVLGLATLAYLDPVILKALNWRGGLVLGGMAAAVAFAFSLLGYYSGDDMILAISHARPLRHEQDPELFNVVEEMAIAAGVPMPRVYVVTASAPNAFATGRDPEHASVTITTGLRRKLTRDELQGVIAHEISHIRNYDIRLMLLMAVLLGTVVMLCDLFWQIVWRGSSRSDRSDRDGDKGGGGILIVILVTVAILLAVVAPILAQIIQLAVSRQREYLADASAVELTRYPQGLANALRKIDADPDVLQVANRGTAHLWIANPIKKFEARAHTAFASHPPIEERIRRLESLVHQTV